MVNKARQTLPMTIKDSAMNKLLFDNNTVKTHLVNQSDFLRKLGFLDKIFSNKQFFLFPTKFIRISRQIKQGEHRQ